MSPQSKSKTVIFFTNAELGQANVVLATAYELLLQGYSIHIASYARQEARVVALNAGAYGPVPSAATFHLLEGPSMEVALRRHFSDVTEICHGTGVREALRVYPELMEIVGVWPGDEYIQIYRSCVEVLQNVDPDVVVIERLCSQAVDACETLGRKHIQLSPNTFKETLAGEQPWGFGLWGWPADVSGFPLPVPWYLIPINIFLMIRLIFAVVLSPRMKELNDHRRAAGIKGPFGMMEPYSKKVTYLLPTGKEYDFPVKSVPDNVIPCGPICLPYPSISTAHPELLSWLKKNPTVLICLGSNMRPSKKFALAQAAALHSLLTQNKNLQVLWKLIIGQTPETQKEGMTAINAVLENEIAANRVRISKWIEAEPASMLATGHIVCYVHHGGANSYFEATYSGVPQIVIPCWFDTFDFALRVEYFGIGIYGSKSCPPGIEAGEFLRALKQITDSGNEKGGVMREKARAMGEVVRTRYRGRVKAAEVVMEVAEGKREIGLPPLHVKKANGT